MALLVVTCPTCNGFGVVHCVECQTCKGTGSTLIHSSQVSLTPAVEPKEEQLELFYGVDYGQSVVTEVVMSKSSDGTISVLGMKQHKLSCIDGETEATCTCYGAEGPSSKISAK